MALENEEVREFFEYSNLEVTEHPNDWELKIKFEQPIGEIRHTAQEWCAIFNHPQVISTTIV